MRAVPRLCEFYPGICLKLRIKHGKPSVRVRKTSVRLRKTSVRVQYTYYQNTHTYTRGHAHTHTHKHTLQNNIKPAQYKLKQTQCKIYPNETVTVLLVYSILSNTEKLIVPQLFNPQVLSNRTFFLLLTTKSLVPVMSLTASIEGRPSYFLKIRCNTR